MRAALKAAIIAGLPSTVAQVPVLRRRTRLDKLYECYVYSCVCRALDQLGAQLEARDSNDQQSTTFRFRLGPGLIYSPSTSSSFILVTFNGNEYELHNGVRSQGTSSVLHELDVAIITRREADRCRADRRDPRSSAVRVVLECKFYGAPLGLHIGREYLGLCTEFRAKVKSLVANVGSDDIQTMVKGKSKANLSLSPLDPDADQTFVRWLRTELLHAL